MKEVTIFAILYGIVPFILYYSLKLNKNLSAIQPFICVVFFASLYEIIGTNILKLNSEYWFIFYKILAFSSISYFFYKLLSNSYIKLFIFFSILFIVLFVYSIVNWNDLTFFVINAYFNVIITLLVLCFSILWFVLVFNNLEIDSFTNSPNFYFVSGLILYYTGTVFLFMASNFIFKMDSHNFQSYWMLNIIFNLVLRTLLIVGIWNGRVK